MDKKGSTEPLEMHSIAFVDTEVDPKSHRILDIGSISNDGGTFHKGSVKEFVSFLTGTKYICGHNILRDRKSVV